MAVTIRTGPLRDELCTMRAVPSLVAVMLVGASCFTADPSEREEQRVTAADGRLLCRLYRVNGIKEGAALLDLPNGGVKSGSYSGGLKNGLWTELDAAGDTTWCMGYTQGRAHGTWQRFTKGRLVYQAHYWNGMAHGPRLTWHTNGAPASLVRFVHGKEEGIAHRWRLSDEENYGMHDTGPYVHGLAHGTWRRYYADGVLCNENEHVQGVMHGISTIYARDGTILRQSEYRNNNKVRTIVDRLK